MDVEEEWENKMIKIAEKYASLFVIYSLSKNDDRFGRSISD